MTDVTAGEGQDTTIQPPQESEAEKRAKRLGWVPKDDFKGDPEHWRSADEFLDWSDKAAPSLRRDNDRLHKRLTEMEGLLKDAKDTLGEFREFASKSEQRAYDRAKAEIQQRIEKGAADADPNAVRAGMAELDELNKGAPKPPQQKTEQRQAQSDPVIMGWLDREQWYSQDKELGDYANATYGFLQATKPGMTTEERLAETKRRTRDEYPHKFGINPARNGAAAVAEPSGGSGAGRARPKTYDALPSEDKKQCDRQVKLFGITRDEWLKHYDWEG